MEDTAEAKVVDEVVDRLVLMFPEVTREAILTRVQTGLSAFSSAPIRDFLPVLVERRVAARLRAESHVPVGLAPTA